MDNTPATKPDIKTLTGTVELLRDPSQERMNDPLGHMVSRTRADIYDRLHLIIKLDEPVQGAAIVNITQVYIDPDSDEDKTLEPGKRVKFDFDVSSPLTLQNWAQNIRLI